MNDDLKNYENKIVYFVIFNIALFILINFDFQVILNNYELISLVFTIPILYFPIYVINNTLSEDHKFFILFPRKHNHHFASDIFSRLQTNNIKNEKIDVDLIIDNHYFPKDFDEEDDLWYDIYIEHRYNPKVFEHHRQFLFSRDFTMLIFPFTGLYLLFMNLIKIPLNNLWIICIITISDFIFFLWLTRHHNEKLVLVVLEEETYKLKKRMKTKKEKIYQKI